MIEQPQTAMVKLLRLYSAMARPWLTGIASWEQFQGWAEQRASEDEQVAELYRLAQEESAIAFQRDHFSILEPLPDGTLRQVWFPRPRTRGSR
jgi:hypothetical protein